MKICKKEIFVINFLFLALVGFGQDLPKVNFTTPLGNIVFEIDTVKAPVTAMNFLNHISSGTYKDAIFYRTVRMDNQPQNEIKIEVIQGGVFYEEKLARIKPIEHETTEHSGLKHLNGTLSMARMEPGTASTEFFICIGEQPELDYMGQRNPDRQGFAAFGKVVQGMDVVLKIQKQKDQDQYLVEPVPIEKVEIIR